MLSATTRDVSAPALADEMLRAVFDLSVAGLALLRPVFATPADAGSPVTDFAFEQLNPAAQRILNLPAAPAETLLTRFPATEYPGFIDFLRQAYHPDDSPPPPATAGLPFGQCMARRQGEWLLVSFAEAGPADAAAPASLARERAAQRTIEEQQRRLDQLTEELDTARSVRAIEAELAQIAAENQHARLERLLLEAPAGICIFRGPELVFEFINPDFQAMFPGRKLWGLPLLAAMPELDGHPAYDSLQRVFRSGATKYEASRLIPIARELGGALEDRYFNYIQQARRDEHGRIDGVVVFAFEVTEQVRAREISERTARQLRLITDSLPIFISYVDRDLRYRFVNQRFEEWFHQQPEQMVGRTVPDVLGEGIYQTVRPFIDRTLRGEAFDFETSVTIPSGEVRHVRASYMPDVQDGTVLGFFSMGIDITEQVMARRQVNDLIEELATTNETLHATNERLTRTNNDLDTFIYTASHDLRAPIINLQGLLEALREELPAALLAQPAIEPVLTMMQGAIGRFQQTIAQLTDIARLQQVQQQDHAEIDLRRLVDDDVRLDLRPLLAGATLTLDVAACPTVRFAPKNLRSIVYNLLSNALKYHAPDRPPVVTLRSYHTAQGAVLEVSDNGLGLTLRQQDRLFLLFNRLHNHVEGSGVGLYMIKRIVDNAGGRIEVESEANVGSTFRVLLPQD